MVRKLLPILLASAVAGCMTPGAPLASRGVESVNQPVLDRATFAVDVAAPGGVLAPSEAARLDGWFRSLDLGYGDSIYVDGGYADAARGQVAAIAGQYGMAVSPGAPITAGAVSPGTVRVVVARRRAEVPGCPNWSTPSSPNWDNRMMPSFGCGVNSNIAAMVANPEDLIHGREGAATGDVNAAAKAVLLYRATPPSGSKGLTDVSTKSGGN